jgi:hypothetical protein
MHLFSAAARKDTVVPGTAIVHRLLHSRSLHLLNSSMHATVYAACTFYGCAADFTNLVSQMHLQDLAEADAAKEQVQQVQVRPCKQHSNPRPCQRLFVAAVTQPTVGQLMGH